MTTEESSKKQQWSAMLDDVADNALTMHPGDLNGAWNSMVKVVRGDPRLREAVFEVLVQEACHERCRRRLSIKNQARWHQTAEFDPTSRGGRLRAAAKTSRHYRLMDYTLMGGTPLAEARKAELLKNAMFQKRQADRMGQTAEWLLLIAEEMTDKQIVRDALTEDRLRELQKSVLGEQAPALVEGD